MEIKPAIASSENIALNTQSSAAINSSITTQDDALLVCNAATRIRSRDTFMLMALWMELYPCSSTPKTSQVVRPTGCVLVDTRDRVIALESTGEAHAIVRAILRCPYDPRGCDMFPCAMCTKVMVQAGIRKIYYFPAQNWEMDWAAHCELEMQIDQGFLSPEVSSLPLVMPADSKTGNTHVDHNDDSIHQLKRTKLSSDTDSTTVFSQSAVPTRDNSVLDSQSFGYYESHQQQPTPHKNVPLACLSPSSPYPPPSTSRHRSGSSPIRRPSTLTTAISEKRDSNYHSVHRLVSNNPIAMSLYIPQWDHSSLKPESLSTSMSDSYVMPTAATDLSPTHAYNNDKKHELVEDNCDADDHPLTWKLDMSVGHTPALSARWPMIVAKFNRTVRAISLLQYRYATAMLTRHVLHDLMTEKSNANQKPSIKKKTTWREMDSYTATLARHAMVLAHIASKRTDDPKVGVGAVLIDSEFNYISVGWNGYPKKAAHFDYPQAGADDSVEDEELKYDYILHAEQNALLWRNPPGVPLTTGSIMVTTKLPCDECSPVISDCGVSCIVSVPQIPKSANDPARFRGLTYKKLGMLIENRWMFVTK
ncbi:hypothetical protein BDV3_000846 [Batrachochytrium dendrobatidis]